MGYNYQAERPWLFTEDGQVALLKARDEAFRLCAMAGACNGIKALAKANVGDTWKMLAILDRLVDLGDLEVIGSPSDWGQDRCYRRPNRR